MSFWPNDKSVSASPPLWKGLIAAGTVGGVGLLGPATIEPLELTGAVSGGPPCKGRRRSVRAGFLPEDESLRAKLAVAGLSLAGFALAPARPTWRTNGRQGQPSRKPYILIRNIYACLLPLRFVAAGVLLMSLHEICSRNYLGFPLPGRTGWIVCVSSRLG